jgi:hypothetical protein
MIRRRWSRITSRGVLFAVLALYTVYAVGPMIWLAAMSLRLNGRNQS